MRTPDYVLNEDHKVLTDNWDEKIMTAGTFVRPIEYCYVPKHIKDNVLNQWYDDANEVFCYTPIGIILIPRKRIRRI